MNKNKLRSDFARAVVVHSDENSLLHALHQEHFRTYTPAQATVILIYPESRPDSALVPIFNKWREKQRAVIYSNGRAEEVNGADYQNFLQKECAMRSMRRVGNGHRKNKTIDDTQKTRLVVNKSVAVRDTFTLSTWDSEILTKHGRPSDWLELTECTRSTHVLLTGRQSLADNWHHDTGNSHIDHWSTDTDRLHNCLMTVLVGARYMNAGKALHARYHADGFPVDPEVHRSEIEQTAKERKTAKFSSHYNLEVGLAIDEWVRNWARRNGHWAEREKRKSVFAEYESRRIEWKYKAISVTADLLAAEKRKAQLEAELITLETELAARRAEDLRLRERLTRGIQMRLDDHKLQR